MTPDDQINSVEIAVASRGAPDPSLPLARRMPVRVLLRSLPLCGALIYIGAAFLPWFTVNENFGALAHTTTRRTAWTYWSGVSGVSAAVVVVIVWLALLVIPHIATRVLLPAQVTFGLFGALAFAGLVGFEAHNLIGLGPQLLGVSFQIGIGAFVAAGGALLVVLFGMVASWPSLAMYPIPLAIDARARIDSRALTGAPSQPLYLPRESVYSQPLPYTPTASQPISYGGQPTFPPGYTAPPSQPIVYGGQSSQPLYGAPPSQPLYGGTPSQPISYGGTPSQPISYGGQPSQPLYGGSPSQPFYTNPLSQPLYGAPPSQPLYGPPAPYSPGGPAPTPTGPQPAMPPYSGPPSQPISYGGQPSQPLYGAPPAQPYPYPTAPWQPPAEKPPARSLPSPFGPPAPPRDVAPNLSRQVEDSNGSNPAEDGAADTPNDDAPA